MSTRLFSVLRRKAGLIDFITPIRPASEGVESYRLKTDTNPFGAFATTVMTVPRTGKVDAGLEGPQNVIQPGENVRIIFKPSNYSLPDSGAFWLKLVFVDASNAEMVSPAPSAATLFLPPFSGPGMTGFNATAPSGASIANSVRLDLPRAMDEFRIRNLETATNLFVATDASGPEIVVPGGAETNTFHGLVSSIWIRGGGATAAFSAQFSYATPR